MRLISARFMLKKMIMGVRCFDKHMTSAYLLALRGLEVIKNG
ncbi:hypothetical protein Stok01_02248 [Sulfurisphaera tokodaii]